MTLRAIKAAEHSIYLNIYEFSSPEIADALALQIASGVHVEVLEEGQPVGGFSEKSKEVESQLLDAMDEGGADSRDRFLIMRGSETKQRRFHFDHAKYIVVDETALLIGSENYSPSGDPERGKIGNRGWQAFLHEPSLAADFKKMFSGDADPSYGDIQKASPRRMAAWGPTSFVVPWPARTDWAAHHSHPHSEQGEGDSIEPLKSEASAANPFTSPNTSLQGLLGAINSAKERLDIELMSFPSRWGISGKRSPLLSAVIAAARRGVKVRALLNDESCFDHHHGGTNGEELQETETDWASSASHKHQNPITVKILNQLASEESLDIQASIADLKAMGVTYIHNKGMLIDGDRVLISSINWTQNAVENNREAAVTLQSQEIHDYYQAIFEKDWNASRYHH